MQLCHPWHHLNLLKFNGSCTSGLNHLAHQRLFAMKKWIWRWWNGQPGHKMSTVLWLMLHKSFLDYYLQEMPKNAIVQWHVSLFIFPNDKMELLHFLNPFTLTWIKSSFPCAQCCRNCNTTINAFCRHFQTKKTRFIINRDLTLRQKKDLFLFLTHHEYGKEKTFL